MDLVCVLAGVTTRGSQEPHGNTFSSADMNRFMFYPAGFLQLLWRFLTSLFRHRDVNEGTQCVKMVSKSKCLVLATLGSLKIQLFNQINKLIKMTIIIKSTLTDIKTWNALFTHFSFSFCSSWSTKITKYTTFKYIPTYIYIKKIKIKKWQKHKLQLKLKLKHII